MKMPFELLSIALMGLGALASGTKVPYDKSFNFGGQIASLDNGNVLVSLSDDTSCDMKFKEAPYQIDCDLHLTVSNKDGKEIKTSMWAGAELKMTVDEENGGIKPIVDAHYKAEVPYIDFSNFDITKNAFDQLTYVSFPKEDVKATIALPTVGGSAEKVCLTNVAKLPVVNSVAGLSTIADISKAAGSDACLELAGVQQADGAASLQLLLHLDFLNKDVSTIKNDNLWKFVNDNIADEIDVTINVGQKVAELIQAKLNGDRRLRRLAGSSGEADGLIDPKTGAFLFGNNVKSTNYGGIVAGSLIGVSVFAIAGVVIIRRRRIARV